MKSKVANVFWPGKVQPPLELGGLGILDLRLFGSTLRMRWLWMQYNELSRSWAKLPF
jgi:hypothetical protein